MITANKKICLLAVLLFAGIPCLGQYVQKIDSLKKLLKNPQHDTIKIIRLNEVARLYNMISPDSSLTYSTLSVKLAESAGYTRGLGKAHINSGIAYDNLGNLEDALKEYAIAKAIYRNSPFTKELSAAYTNSGIVYIELGKYDSALKQYNQSLQYKDSVQDLESIGIVKTNIGVLYHDLGDLDKALEYFLESTDIARRVGDQQGIADNNLNVADIYAQQGKHEQSLAILTATRQLQEKLGDKEGLCYTLEAIGNNLCKTNNFKQALDYFSRALSIASEMKLLLRTGAIEQSLGDCYAANSNYEKALLHFNNSMKANTEVGDVKSLIINHVSLGKIYTDHGNAALALEEYKQAAAMGEESGYLEGLSSAYQGLAKIYETAGDYENAFNFYVKQSVVKDSLHNADESLHLMRLQVQFETEQKDQQIALLNTKSRLQESERRKQLLLRNILLGGLAVLIAFAILLFNNVKRKQKTNSLLTEKNTTIEEQKKQVEKTYRELQASQEQLVQSEKMASLGQLTAGIAHEINNPINFVSANVNPLKRNFQELKNLLNSYSELLLQSDKKTMAENLEKESDVRENLAESENLLNGIEEGSRRTAQIVKGLRNFTRLNEEEMKLADVNEGIESTLVLLNNKLDHEGIEVIQSLGEIPKINCFPGQLNQVLMNLINNAVDAISVQPLPADDAHSFSVAPPSRVERKVYITTLCENNTVKISIRDTGSGMSDEIKKKIFDPFFTTKDVGKGSGLGLSISYGIIKKHNGTIDVISEVEKGSTFIITLPES